MAQAPIDYAALATRHGGTRASSAPPQPDASEAGAIDYAALAREHGGAQADQPDFRTTNERDAQGAPVVSEESWLDPLVDFGRGVWKNVNPIDAVKGAATAVQHPIETMKAVGAAQGELAGKAKQAFDEGDYATGLRHSLAYLLPLIGPGLDVAADKMAAGEYAEGAGEAVGMGLGMFSPALLKGARLKVPAPLKNVNPVEAEAVAFGAREGIPVDAGTASGNRFVKGAQRLADESLVGSVVGGRGREAQTRGLATLGDQLAAKGYPSLVTTEQAGAGVRTAVSSKVTQLHGTASDAYDALRAIEADPKHATKVVITPEVAKVTSDGRRAVLQPEVSETIPLAVDIRDAKTDLRPTYDRLSREAQLVPGAVMGAKAKALAALDRLMNAPDVAPLSAVDDALGDLKAMARGAEIPALRTDAQGIAAQAVKALEAKVQARASKAGPEAIKALMEGRAATKQKYSVAEMLEGLSDEPVKTVKTLVAPRDSAIEQLRGVAKVAPDEMPKVARAYLDDMLRKATNEGGFDHAQRMQATWTELGPETKKLLFKDADYIKDLDRFFLLAKKLSENPNPSGSALTVFKGAELTHLWANPVVQIPLSLGVGALAKMLRSPAVVKVLTRGMSSARAGNRTVVAAETANLIRAAREAGIPLEVSPAAEDQRAGSTAGSRSPQREKR